MGAPLAHATRRPAGPHLRRGKFSRVGIVVVILFQNDDDEDADENDDGDHGDHVDGEKGFLVLGCDYTHSPDRSVGGRARFGATTLRKTLNATGTTMPSIIVAVRMIAAGSTKFAAFALVASTDLRRF